MTTPTNARRPLRATLEQHFESWAGFVHTRPWPILLACLLAVALLAPQIRNITIDTHPENFLVETHPVRVSYDDFKGQFGSDNFLIIPLEHDSVFSLEFLDWLGGLHRALDEGVPHIADITSLLNARTTRGKGDKLIVEDLLDEWPTSEEEVLRIREIVRTTPFHQRMLISDDERHTAILLEIANHPDSDGDAEDAFGGFDGLENDESTLPPLTGIHEAEIIRTIREIVAAHSRPDVRIGLAGLTAMNISIGDSTGEGLARFMSLSILMIMVILAFLFRRAAGVFIPLAVVIAAVVTTFGVTGLVNPTVNMTIQIIPSFLLAVGASAAIHLLVLFFQNYDAGADRGEALRRALGHAGLPVSMACLTTAAGMASFLAADLVTIRDVGRLMPIGTMLCLIYVLTLLPALLCIVPLERRRPANHVNDEPKRVNAFIVAAGDWAVCRPVTTLVVAAAIVGISALGASRTEFDTDGLMNISRNHPIHRDIVVADTQMAGSTSLELIIDTGVENGLYEPAFQERLEAFESRMMSLEPDAPYLRKAISVNDVLKEIHQALNENRVSHYTTPDDRDLIAQELLLFENSGSDDLEDLVDSQFRIARISLQAVWQGAAFYTKRIEQIKAEAIKAFPDSRIQLTGVLAILMTALHELQLGLLKSYSIALLTITPMMMFLVGTLRGGLASMVPNLVPVLIVAGIFGWIGKPIDMFSMMTGSIAIGLAVDDTIHFFHNFYREFNRTGDTRASVRRTLETTGSALLTTSIVLSVGFSVFVFSTVPVLQTFGAITTLAIALAFAADVLIAPALVTLATRKRQSAGVAPLP